MTNDRRHDLIELAFVSLRHGNTEKATVALIEAEADVDSEEDAEKIVQAAQVYLLLRR